MMCKMGNEKWLELITLAHTHTHTQTFYYRRIEGEYISRKNSSLVLNSVGRGSGFFFATSA